MPPGSSTRHGLPTRARSIVRSDERSRVGRDSGDWPWRPSRPHRRAVDEALDRRATARRAAGAGRAAAQPLRRRQVEGRLGGHATAGSGSGERLVAVRPSRGRGRPGSPSVGRSASAWRSAARTPHRPRRGCPRAPQARATAAKSIGPRSVAIAPSPAAAPILVHPDRPVTLVVEHDGDDLAPSRGRRSPARPSSSRSRRRRRARRPAGRGGRAPRRSPPAGRSPSPRTSGPRNVPGRRNRKWRATHRPKLPASVVTIASSGSTRRSVGDRPGRDGRRGRSRRRRRRSSPPPRPRGPSRSSASRARRPTRRRGPPPGGARRRPAGTPGRPSGSCRSAAGRPARSASGSTSTCDPALVRRRDRVAERA